MSDVRTLFFDNLLIALHSFSFAQNIKDHSSLLSVRSIYKSDVPSSGLRYDISDNRQVPVRFFMVKFLTSRHLKRVTGRIFTISKLFHRGKQKLCSERQLKFVKTMSAHSKSTILNLGPTKIFLLLLTLSL